MHNKLILEKRIYFIAFKLNRFERLVPIIKDNSLSVFVAQNNQL